MVQLTTENIKWVALTAVIAVAAVTVIGSGVLAGLSSDSIEITEASLIKGSNTDALVTVSITNLGGGPVDNFRIEILEMVNKPDAAVPKVDSVDAGTGDNKCGTRELNAISTAEAETFIWPKLDADESLGTGDTLSFSKTIAGTKDTVSIGDSYPLQVQVTSSDCEELFATAIVRVTGI